MYLVSKSLNDAVNEGCKGVNVNVKNLTGDDSDIYIYIPKC